ncbi:hypothetical protein EVJ58_g7245 [Rhodofomes roseus]|uniref:TRAF-type domain-containing protein n=1 Tax=Rhodofomes roseus TaxID=34475 RepID=A0A4Y9Y4F5_9APHY|nr:hypothetical protein EVJ58_g7245 [Rhodofomes roseus]
MLLPVHLKDSCKYVEVPCSEGKCSKGVLRKDLASHTHAHDVSSEEDTGRSSPCLDSSSVDGRGEKSHESQESPQPSQEDARNFPDTTNSSYEALEVENARLRLRLSSLEGVVNTLQYELQAVRQALGPWYRTQDTDVRRGWGGTPQHQERYSSMNPAPSTSAIIDPLVLPQASSSRDENTSAASVSAPPLATSPTSPTAPSELVAGSDLSSYFPPAEEEDVYSPDFVRTHQAHRTTAMGSSQPRDSSHHPYRSGTQRIPLSQSQPASGHAYPPHAFSPTGYPAGPAPPHPDLGAISIPAAGPECAPPEYACVSPRVYCLARGRARSIGDDACAGYAIYW